MSLEIESRKFVYKFIAVAWGGGKHGEGAQFSVDALSAVMISYGPVRYLSGFISVWVFEFLDQALKIVNIHGTETELG